MVGEVNNIVPSPGNNAYATPPVSVPVPYKFVSRKSILDIIKDNLPAGAQPTEKTPKILGGIFLVVVILGVLNFPFFGVFGGNTNIAIEVGIPLKFLELKLNDPRANPIHVGNLVVDLFFYILLAYLIDIGINIFMNAKFLKSEEELKGEPKEYKVRPTFGQRAMMSAFKN